MNLKDEISALRAEIDARAKKPEPAKPAEPSPAAMSTASDVHDVEGLIEMAGAMIDEFSDELEKYPKLAALAALGIGLSVGFLVGRQSR